MVDGQVFLGRCKTGTCFLRSSSSEGITFSSGLLESVGCGSVKDEDGDDAQHEEKDVAICGCISAFSRSRYRCRDVCLWVERFRFGRLFTGGLGCEEKWLCVGLHSIVLDTAKKSVIHFFVWL